MVGYKKEIKPQKAWLIKNCEGELGKNRAEI